MMRRIVNMCCVCICARNWAIGHMCGQHIERARAGKQKMRGHREVEDEMLSLAAEGLIGKGTNSRKL